MNGRLYDPLLNRFLSPDSFVQMPESSQGFNRYSYCLNNPLKYTDPSGEMFRIDDLLFVATIGTISGYTNAIINGTGTNSVYLGTDNEHIVRYVGITQRKPQERFSEHLRSKSNRSTLHYKPIQNTGNLSRQQALIIEQTFVNLWKMEKNGGILYNKINPIAPRYWDKYGIK